MSLPCRSVAEIIADAKSLAVKDGYTDPDVQRIYIKWALAAQVDSLIEENASLRAEQREGVTV